MIAMDADEIVDYARFLMGDDGLRETTEHYLRRLVREGPDARLGTEIGTGKSTALAIYYMATGQLNFDLPRHERRVIDCYVENLRERRVA